MGKPGRNYLPGFFVLNTFLDETQFKEPDSIS